MQNLLKKISTVVCIWLSLGLVSSPQPTRFYVSVDGLDANPGTIQKPFATLQRAQQAIQEWKARNTTGGIIQVLLRGGIYELDSSLLIKKNEGETVPVLIEYKPYLKEKVVLSGQKSLLPNWKKQPDQENKSNLWKMYIPEARNKQWIFRQLFANGKRLQRATSPFLRTSNPLPKYIDKIKRFDFKGNNKLRDEEPEAYCSFQYKDLPKSIDIKGAELIIYHSWETSWHSIYKIDSISKSIYLKTPFTYPIGFFSPETPYRVENSWNYFDEAGEWYLDVENGELWYKAKEDENPNQLDFIIPKTNQLVTISGDRKGDRKESNEKLVFENINFEYTADTVGVTYLTKKQKNIFLQKCPWLDFSTGYTSYQTAADCGSTISLNSCSNIRFERCSFSRIGGYGIKINQYTSDITINNCTMNDMGGGGILIGFPVSKPILMGIPEAASPSRNTVSNCIITNGGKLHGSAVGIALMQANNTIVIHNEIAYFPYTGISCGWTWDKSENFTKQNRVEYNVIHDVMQQLADGGGIYTLGEQPGTSIKGNYIYNIKRSANAIGSKNNGLFFDESSSKMTVEKNVVTSVENGPYRFNKSDSTTINLKNNYFKEQLNKRDKSISSLINNAGYKPLKKTDK